ncbi:hypothetical protein D3C71_79590 [compost metagenome]
MNLAMLLEEGDFDRPAIDIVLDLIYITNQIRVPKEKVVFGVPEKLDQRPDIIVDANTFIPVDFDPDWDDRYRGENGFLYRRLPLSVLTPDPDVHLRAMEFPFHLHDLLPAIRAKFNTQFTTLDLEDQLIENEFEEIQLRAAETSLLWIGETPIDIEGMMPLENIRVTTDGRYRVTTQGIPRRVVPTPEV